MKGTWLEEDDSWRRAISAILNGTKKPGLGRYPSPGLSTWKIKQLSLADHQLLADMDHIIREVIPVFEVLHRHAVLLGNAV
jgi:hypothetical protein